jgi:hypothetical protein
MTIRLNYKDVAQKNIDDFGRLGAFLGASGCYYAYDNGTLERNDVEGVGCAIGICFPFVCGVIELPEGEDGYSDNESPIKVLIEDVKSVVTDNQKRLEFIQALHDYRTGSTWRSFLSRCTEEPNGRGSLTDLDESRRIEIPNSVLDLVKDIIEPRDVTPALYKEVMARLVAE